jgi:hypothetical protein
MVGPSDCESLQRDRLHDAKREQMDPSKRFLDSEEVAEALGETWWCMVTFLNILTGVAPAILKRGSGYERTRQTD